MFGLTCGVVALLAALQSVGAQPLPAGKKLIEYGWDVPNPTYVREHIREMEQRPFDGLIFRMAVGGRVFVPDKWTPQQVEPDFEQLGAIEWDRFTDNFLVIYAASDIDWFDDAQWEAAIHNTRLTARAARIGKCVGVCFDAEPYGHNPWLYSEQPRAKEKSFAEYQAQYRERGAQFMDAVQSEMPNAVVHTFFVFSFQQHLWDLEDPAVRDRKLEAEGYGLYPAFINGMLDAIGPTAALTDGNEGAYYYEDTLSFYRSYHGIRQRALSMLDPANIPAYRAQVQVAQALYVDHLFDLRGDRDYLSSHLSPEERAQWFQHNVYHALATSDRYVWLYSEKMNWWLNESLPPGLEDAVVQARTKLAARQGLGYDLAPLIEAGRKRQREALRTSLIQRSMDIPRLAGPAPTIDGDLADAAWQGAPPLDPFLRYVLRTGNPVAPTEARVAWDAAQLYVAVRCVEPKRAEMAILGTERDDSVWMGDSVDLFLQPPDQAPAYYHFIMNPQGVLWDSRVVDTDDMAYTAAAVVGARPGDGEWTVELAIPWGELKAAAPAPGSQWRANLCRQRIPDGEQTAWSQCVAGFVEPESFGTWTFR
jgi:hypothetical protein